MGLVDDDGVVAGEHGVGLDLGEQDAVGHEFDEGAGAGLLGEAHLVTDHPVAPDGRAQLVGDALGHAPGGDAPGLGVADHGGDAAAQFQADLGQLGGFAAAGLARDDDDLVVADRLGDLLAAGGDGQFLGVDDRGHGCGALGELVGGETGPFGAPGRPTAAGPVRTAAVGGGGAALGAAGGVGLGVLGPAGGPGPAAALGLRLGLRVGAVRGWCVLHRRTIVPHMSPRALRAYPPRASRAGAPLRPVGWVSCGAVVVIPVGFPPRSAARCRGWRRRRGSKRWPAHIFRVRGGSRASGEWRHCATSGWKGRGAEGERSATATFLSRWTAPSPARPSSQRRRTGQTGRM